MAERSIHSRGSHFPGVRERFWSYKDETVRMLDWVRMSPARCGASVTLSKLRPRTPPIDTTCQALIQKTYIVPVNKIEEAAVFPNNAFEKELGLFSCRHLQVVIVIRGIYRDRAQRFQASQFQPLPSKVFRQCFGLCPNPIGQKRFSGYRCRPFKCHPAYRSRGFP